MDYHFDLDNCRFLFFDRNVFLLNQGLALKVTTFRRTRANIFWNGKKLYMFEDIVTLLIVTLKIIADAELY